MGGGCLVGFDLRWGSMEAPTYLHQTMNNCYAIRLMKVEFSVVSEYQHTFCTGYWLRRIYIKAFIF